MLITLSVFCFHDVYYCDVHFSLTGPGYKFSRVICMPLSLRTYTMKICKLMHFGVYIFRNKKMILQKPKTDDVKYLLTLNIIIY